MARGEVRTNSPDFFRLYYFLSKNKTKLFHFPYWLAYFGGLCFDLLAFITRRKFAISAIRVKKFTQNIYFVSSNIKKTDFVPPVALEQGLQNLNQCV